MVIQQDRFSFHTIKVEITLGFIALLFITALLAGNGWDSLNRFSKGVAQSESMNLWVSTLVKLRRYEREYKIHQNPDQLLLMQSEISNLQSRIERSYSQLNESNDAVFLDGILRVTDQYQSSFQRYVEQQQEMDLVKGRLIRAVSEMESSFSRLAIDNINRFHLLGQQLEGRWDLLLKDLDERELLDSFSHNAAELERRQLLSSQPPSDKLASELVVELTSLAESLIPFGEGNESNPSYKKLLGHSQQLHRLLHSNPSSDFQKIAPIFVEMAQILKDRETAIARQILMHRLQYDVAQGSSIRSQGMAETAKQLQIWIGNMQRQEKEFLLASSQINAAKIREQIRQVRLSTEDAISGAFNDDNRMLLSNVLSGLDHYQKDFDRLQALVIERRRADLDMSGAINELQVISRTAANKRAMRLQGWYETATQQFWIGSIVVFSVAVWLSILVGSRLSKSITSITDTISRVAAGDHDVKTPGLHRRDEIGKMAAAVEVFKQTLIKSVQLQKQQYEENRARRRAEAEVRSLNAELEARVIRRTEQLQSANSELEQALDTLKQAQKQLIESEKMAALSTLVAGVAHELNTPLGNSITAITLLNEQLQEVEAAFGQGMLSRQQMVDFIGIGKDVSRLANENLGRAAQLITSFKTLAMDPEESDASLFQLSKVIEDSFTSLNHILEPSGLEVNYQCDPDISIQGYPSDLFQVISNLVNNSIEHAYPNGYRGELKLSVEKSKDHVSIQYSDDGQGMSEEQQQKVFDPFFTTDRSQGGTGLGMHLVYNLVTQRLRGNIQCQSVEGQGSSFLIRIPLS